MRHYSFHIGDYAAAARYLSKDEDLAFRRLLDVYYLDERPLPADVDECARLVGLVAERDAVAAVLQRFFVLDEARGWVNHRAETQIAEYQAQIESCRAAGRRSAERRAKAPATPQTPTPPDDRPAGRRGARSPASRRQQPFNDRSTPVEHPSNGRAAAVQQVCNQPETNNHIPPNPPPTGGRAVARGASAAHERPAPDPAADSRTAEERLAAALLATPFRNGIGNPFTRRVEVLKCAAELVKTGLTPEDVPELEQLAEQESNPAKGTPGGLLARWLDRNEWRMELDKRDAQDRHAAARRRARMAASVVTQGEPLPLAQLLAGQGVA